MGETHIYNSCESRFAESYINQFDLVLYEGLELKDQTWLQRADEDIFRFFYKQSIWFIARGSGRRFENKSLFDYSVEKHIPILRLEEDLQNERLEPLQKIGLTSLLILGTVASPITYIPAMTESYDEPDTSLKRFQNPSWFGKFTGELANSSKRDSVMAMKAVEYLQDNPEKNILLVVGKYHVPGMIKILSDYLKRR